MANEKEQQLGFQLSSSEEKETVENEINELLEIADDFSELQGKVAEMLSHVEEEKEKTAFYKKLENIESLLKALQPAQQRKISWLREKALELIVGIILLLLSGFVLVQINHTRDIAGENQTGIGIANTRLENAATKEELANMRAELNASLSELRIEFITINRNLEAIIKNE